MPIYIYKCIDCGKVDETIETTVIAKPRECMCGGEMRRAVAGHANTPKKWTV